MNTYVVTATKKVSFLVLAVSVAHEHEVGVDGNIWPDNNLKFHITDTWIRHCQEQWRH